MLVSISVELKPAFPNNCQKDVEIEMVSYSLILFQSQKTTYTLMKEESLNIYRYKQGIKRKKVYEKVH